MAPPNTPTMATHAVDRVTSSDANVPASLKIKIIISIICFSLLLFHIMWKSFDPVALGILALGLLPWLPAFLDVAELPGGIKFQFAKVKREQERQAQELAWIKLLIDLVFSDYERTHLRNLAAEGPFLADINKGSTFEWELRHLASLQLIDRLPGKGIGALFSQGGRCDVKEHLYITQKGLDYLKIVEEARLSD